MNAAQYTPKVQEMLAPGTVEIVSVQALPADEKGYWARGLRFEVVLRPANGLDEIDDGAVAGIELWSGHDGTAYEGRDYHDIDAAFEDAVEGLKRELAA